MHTSEAPPKRVRVRSWPARPPVWSCVPAQRALEGHSGAVGRVCWTRQLAIPSESRSQEGLGGGLLPGCAEPLHTSSFQGPSVNQATLTVCSPAVFAHVLPLPGAMVRASCSLSLPASPLHQGTSPAQAPPDSTPKAHHKQQLNRSPARPSRTPALGGSGRRPCPCCPPLQTLPQAGPPSTHKLSERRPRAAAKWTGWTTLPLRAGLPAWLRRWPGFRRRCPGPALWNPGRCLPQGGPAEGGLPQHGEARTHSPACSASQPRSWPPGVSLLPRPWPQRMQAPLQSLTRQPPLPAAASQGVCQPPELIAASLVPGDEREPRGGPLTGCTSCHLALPPASVPGRMQGQRRGPSHSTSDPGTASGPQEPHPC